MKDSNSDMSFYIYITILHIKKILPLGLLGYCETNAPTSPTKKIAYRVNNILQLLDICQSIIQKEELSIINILSKEKRNTDNFRKTSYFKTTFQISKYTEEQQNTEQCLISTLR